jgi:DNA-directed RNA polymerase specialized sigma24 family protein
MDLDESKDASMVRQAFPEFIAGFVSGNTSTQAADRDLLEHLRRRFSPTERFLLDERLAGRDWSAIARARGAAPETLRKRLYRALQRLAARFGAGRPDSPR